MHFQKPALYRILEICKTYLLHITKFEFYVENEAGKSKQVDIKNAGFKEKVVNNVIAGWFKVGSYGKVRIKEFTFSSSGDSANTYIIELNLILFNWTVNQSVTYSSG